MPAEPARPDPGRPSRAERLTLAVVVAFAASLGLYAAWVYHRAGMTLMHYDAKAHLVVARRVLDSLTPGWTQLGGLWLPLPHLLNLLPVQVDAFYRTGASAVAFSVAGFVLAEFACARIVLRLSGSAPAALASSLVLALNPNLLYLQATPMTESLLIGLTLVAVSLLIDWVDDPRRTRSVTVGVALAAAWLTRYEAWPVISAALAAALVALLRRGTPWKTALLRAAGLASFPVAALGAFLLQSRFSTGDWFISGGFYAPDNLLDGGHPARALVTVWWGTHKVSTYPLLVAATAGWIALLVAAVRKRERADAFLVVSLLAAAILPWYAFHEGHPYRMRYMIPLVGSMAVAAGSAIGLLPRARWLAAVLLAALALFGMRPIDFEAPMVVEAQLDRQNQEARRAVTACLAARKPDELVMVSMGSLAHYVQELSVAGFRVRDFVHEGNGALWQAALYRPERSVGWILIEEHSEGGDVLAAHARERPGFLAAFERTCEGGGVALYRRMGRRGHENAEGAHPGVPLRHVSGLAAG